MKLRGRRRRARGGCGRGRVLPCGSPLRRRATRLPRVRSAGAASRPKHRRHNGVGGGGTQESPFAFNVASSALAQLRAACGAGMPGGNVTGASDECAI